ncbi:ABC transporter substrate-binding protein [Paraburkholderia sp. BCC1885]|uniref:ABC transporter substrate-binding protein n=1 Tax=Paraburkholderia sp. BCC1885 TaxID=2562669 RepID=UPI0016425893|nr:ABC transporter substrate-binding protein [Paraburkholderia sp. BCC1885]
MRHRARRNFLKQAGQSAIWASCLGMCAGQPVAAASKIPRRVVVMDWPLTEMLLALGVVPVGVSAPDWYRRTIVDPPLPSDVVNIGLLYSPNYEVLEELAPDLMIITPGHAPARPLLERLAPTLTLGRYARSAQPYDALRAETTEMARVVGRSNVGDGLLERTDSVVGGVRARMELHPELLRRPVVLAELIDDRYLRVYGAGSLLDTMMSKIGVTNAVNQGRGQPAWSTGSDGVAVVSMQRLFDSSQATLLLLGDIRSSQRMSLRRSVIWQALPSMISRRVTVLPVIAPNGGLVSMQRFVLAIERALTDIAGGRGGLG